MDLGNHQSKTPIENRNQYYDIIRGVAIILMVFGHSLQYGSGTDFLKSTAFFDDKLFQFIYSFHMPLFMFLSGYLAFYSVSRYTSFTLLLKNKARLLLFPILGWQTFAYIIKVITALIHGESITFSFIYIYGVSYIRSLYADIWYLWLVFDFTLLVYLVRRYCKDCIWIYLVLFIITFFVPASVINSNYCGFMYPFFIVGYWCKKNEAKTNQVISKIGLAKVFLLITICYTILFAFWNINSYIYTTGFSLWGHPNMAAQFGIDIYRMCIGFAGTFLIMLFIKIVYSHSQANIIWTCCAKAGQQSICIYMLSGYMVHWFLEANGDKFHVSYAMNVLQATVITVFCYFLGKLLSKIPILKVIMLGGR